MPTRSSPDLVLEIPPTSARRSRLMGTLLVIGVVALISAVGRYIYLIERQFTAVAALRGLGAIVVWDVDRGNFLQGGKTEVNFRGQRDHVRNEDLTRLLDLSDLEHLDLSGCHNITGAGLERVGRLSSLKELHLDADPAGGSLTAPQLSDSDLPPLKSLKRLKVLGLNGTRITDLGLETLRELPSLEYLDLGGTRITPAGLERLRGLPHLKTLRIDGTAITLEQSAAFQRSVPNFEVVDDVPADENMVRMRAKRDY